MVNYSKPPVATLKSGDLHINSFVQSDEQNVDQKTVASFGNEWQKFHHFKEDDLTTIGNDYFDIATEILNQETVALDVGCGSGRWSKFLSDKVQFIEAIDPSTSVFTAAHYLNNVPNVRLTHASVNSLPFPDNSFDFVFSLGVLHHVPDTAQAIQACFNKVKKSGHFLVYLYYNLDNRGPIIKALFFISNLLRKVISRLPSRIKTWLCDLIAVLVYWPLSRVAAIVQRIAPRVANQMPLAYYAKTSFAILRNDSLDRFGTPLEKRFSKKEIEQMLLKVGFKDIVFSPKAPYWHVIARKE